MYACGFMLLKAYKEPYVFPNRAADKPASGWMIHTVDVVILCQL